MKQPLVGRERKCEGGKVAVFDCQATTLLSFLPLDSIGGMGLNDIWGWTDSASKREFALVGRKNGTSFVEVTDPVNPRYLGQLPLHEGASPSSWRDIKVYKNHAFIVADGAGKHGMQVFDLTQLLTASLPPVTFTETVHYDNVASVHNIAINEATGFAYLIGTSSGGETCGGGLHMVDIRDPKNPTFAACHAEQKTGRAGTGYIHDTQCTMYHGPDQKYRGKELCLNSAETALSIVDVTKKDQAATIGIGAYPNVAYSHQGWFSEDQRYFFLSDELDEGRFKFNTRTIVFDLKDLSDPIVVKEFLGSTPATDHNLYVRGRYVFQSAYAAGLRILDAIDPVNLKEVGYFDTNPDINTAQMNGSWSNYPYFPSGTIVATGMAHGLFVVRHDPPADGR